MQEDLRMSFQVLTTEWWTASYQHRVRFRVGSLFKTLRNLRRKTLQVVDPEQGNPDIWGEDLKDGSLVRITTATGSDVLPMWSPDGLRPAYGSGSLKERQLSIAAADGTGVLKELPCPGPYCEPPDWSPDGQRVHFIDQTPAPRLSDISMS
jgi:Tol biopolymer transport system component